MFTVDEETTHPTISKVGEGAMGNNGIAIGAALGGVSAVLLLILMGVVMGWVCTCYKASKPQHRYENASAHNAIISDSSRSPNVLFINPSYNQATSAPLSSSHPIQYSSQGPRDTPTNHTPGPILPHTQMPDKGKSEGGEGIYHVLELESGKGDNFGVYEEIEEREREGERIYHVLGDAVEGKMEEVACEVLTQNNSESATMSKGKQQRRLVLYSSTSRL